VVVEDGILKLVSARQRGIWDQGAGRADFRLTTCGIPASLPFVARLAQRAHCDPRVSLAFASLLTCWSVISGRASGRTGMERRLRSIDQPFVMRFMGVKKTKRNDVVSWIR
jgi:hypothetical protein